MNSQCFKTPRLRRFLYTVTTMAVFCCSPAFAGGAGPGGGGNCEERFKAVAEDLLKWADHGVPGLQFQEGESAASYAGKVKPLLQNYEVHCVALGDAGFPVEVDGVPKECKNEMVDGKLQITCDQWKFYTSLGENKDKDLSQYRLVHHEFSSAADLEPHNGSSSNYTYSKLLTPERILLFIKPLGGSVAIKVSRLERSQSQIRTRVCQQISKVVKGYDDDGRMRASITETSCAGSRQAPTYSVKFVSESGGSFTSEGLGLPESSGLPGSFHDLAMYNRNFPLAGLKMQTLFHRLQQNEVSCRIIVVSSEGTLVDDDVCKFND